MPPEVAKSTLNPTALSVADAARMLARVSGFGVTEAMIRADIEAAL